VVVAAAAAAAAAWGGGLFARRRDDPERVAHPVHRRNRPYPGEEEREEGG
jgi:hypothetical protein